jgi:hypothetical protein
METFLQFQDSLDLPADHVLTHGCVLRHQACITVQCIRYVQFFGFT